MDFGGQPRWSSCIRCSEDTDFASSGWRIHPSSFSGQSGISVQEGPSPAREKQPGRGTGKKPCPNECSEEQSSYFSFSYFSCAWPRRLAPLSCWGDNIRRDCLKNMSKMTSHATCGRWCSLQLEVRTDSLKGEGHGGIKDEGTHRGKASS